MNKRDIILLIEKDEWMMNALRAAQSLNLPDWWIGAGFVRSKIWDYLHGYKKRTPLPDIDCIYFDAGDFTENEMKSDTTKAEKDYEKALGKLFPSVKWSVTNQARMHIFHDRPPYKSSEEALSGWVETATCIGVKLENGKIILSAPHGVKDLVNLILRPTPNYIGSEWFDRRMKEKKWIKKWFKLKIVV